MSVPNSWYVRLHGNTCGPMDTEGLMSLVAEGRVTPQTQVSLNSTTWMAAEKVKGLFPATARITAAPPALPKVAVPRTESRKPVTPPKPVESAQGSNWLPWVLVGVLVIALLGGGVTIALLSRSNKAPVVAADVSDKPLSTQEIVAKYEKSVALIETPTSTGTGFVVGTGLLATNAHVIVGGAVEQLRVSFPSVDGGKQSYHVQAVLWEDRKIDLAILEVKTDRAALPLSKGEEFSKGQAISIIGSPGFGDGTLENAVCQGVLSTKTEINGCVRFQLGATVNPGNSGGPVFDSHGRVIGVVVSKAVKQEAISFCIPVAEVENSLRKIEGMSSKEKSEATSRHDLRFLYHNLRDVGAFYLVGLDLYIKGMQAAVAAGKPPTDGLKIVSQKIDAELAELEKGSLVAIRGIAPKVIRDTQISQSVRDRVKELHEVYQDAKELFDKPGGAGSVQGFEQKTREFQSRHRRLINALKLEIDGELGN